MKNADLKTYKKDMEYTPDRKLNPDSFYESYENNENEFLVHCYECKIQVSVVAAKELEYFDKKGRLLAVKYVCPKCYEIFKPLIK